MNMMTEAARVARHEVARAALGAAGGEFLTFRLSAEEYGIFLCASSVLSVALW